MFKTMIVQLLRLSFFFLLVPSTARAYSFVSEEQGLPIETQDPILPPPMVWCQMQELDVQYLREDASPLTAEMMKLTDEIAPLLMDPLEIHEQSLVCVVQADRQGPVSLPAGDIYRLTLPDAVVSQLDLRSNQGSRLAVRNLKRIDQEQAIMETDDQTEFFVVPSGLRKLQQAGRDRRTILVLRVTHDGVAPTASREELSRAILNGPINLVGQLAACSFGHLQLQAMQPGILDVSVVNLPSGTSAVGAVENAAVQAASKLLGSSLESLVDHVLLIMPPGLKLNGRSYLAYAYTGGMRSVYSDTWGTRLSALAHEFGHNLRLGHSGRGDSAYGDRTGYLGFGSNKLDGPANCYNAQKHWDLGWFEDRVLSLTVRQLPWAGTLATFADYDRIDDSSDVPVILQVGDSDPRFFVQYNRAKGVNRGTRSLADQVVIIMDRGSQNEKGLQSWLQGGLSLERPRFRYVYEDGSMLVMELCEQLSGNIDSVRMSIYLDNGSQQSSCPRVSAPRPTPRPTPRPVSRPTRRPTPRPVAREEEEEEEDTVEWDGVCREDKDAMYFVEQKGGTRSCNWLALRLAKWGGRLCVPGQGAFAVCPQTCGRCCQDDPSAKFYVNKKKGRRDCEWLADESKWKRKLCKSGTEAYEACPVTCDRCDD